MFKAAGRFGSPGMVITSPVRATTKPAPVLGTNSRMVMSKPEGAPRRLGSSEKLYCVLACLGLGFLFPDASKEK